MTKERLQELIGENLSNDGKTLYLGGNRITTEQVDELRKSIKGRVIA